MVGKKLLVADDSLTIQKVIRLALSNEGYEIKAVSDGNEAIQEISVFRPDVVLIDVSLPGKTAFEVKRAIHELHDFEETRFILMSSAFEKVDEAQYDELQFHGRFTKPFDPAHLRKVLSEVLGQVVAKRMEPTSLIQQPHPLVPPPPPPPTMDQLAHDTVSDDELPIIQEPPAPPPLSGEDFEPLWKAPELDSPDLQQWAVQDKKLRAIPPPPKMMDEKTLENLRHKTPPLAPPPGFGDDGGTSFSFENQAVPAAMIPPPPKTESLSIELSDEEEDLPTPVLLEDEDDVQPVFEAPPSLEHHEIIAGQPIPQLTPSQEPVTGASSIPDAAWIERLVKKQVEESLAQLAQRLLPDIAERVIKEEIHKLLEQAP